MVAVKPNPQISKHEQNLATRAATGKGDPSWWPTWSSNGWLAMNEEGIHKSAVLLLSLGEEQAVQVLKHLTQLEVQKLGAAMAKLKNLSMGQIDAVLSDFCSRVVAEPLFLDPGSRKLCPHRAGKSLGRRQVHGQHQPHPGGQDTSGIEGLKWVDSQSVAELIKGEHPQIIATILVHLDRAQASDILGLLTEQLRNDVLLRIATLEGIQPSALRELNTVLTDLLSGSENINKSSVGGIRTAAEIINFMGSAAESSVLDNLREFDADLAQKIMDQMIVFENLMDIDDRGIQLLLREIQSEH